MVIASASHPAEFFQSALTSQLRKGIYFLIELINLVVGVTPILSRYRTAYSCSSTSTNSFVNGYSSYNF